MKDEYAKVGVPMLPVVRGEDETRRQILLYTVLLYAVTQLPFCAGGFGAIYLVARRCCSASRSSAAPCALYGAPTAGCGTAHVPVLARLPALLFAAMVVDAKV